MIYNNKIEGYSTKSCCIIEPFALTLAIFTGETQCEALSMTKLSPSVRKIDFSNSVNSILTTLDFNPDELVDRVGSIIGGSTSLNILKIIKRETQACLCNIGLPIIDVFGVRNNGILYGYDFGFELKFTDFDSVYVDFSCCHFDSKFNKSVLITGVDLRDNTPITAIKRDCGTFHISTKTFELCSFKGTPEIVKMMIGEVDINKIFIMPNLTIFVENVYSGLKEDSMKFFELESEDMVCSLATAIVDSKKIALQARQIGSDILRKVATSDKVSSGLSTIGSVKILQSSCVESLGDLLLVETSQNSALHSKCEYEEVRSRVISKNSLVNTDQYKLAFTASNSINQMGVARCLNEASLNEIINSLISREYHPDSNVQNHKILDLNNNIIGYLKSSDNPTVYQQYTNINKPKLLKVQCSDDYATRAEVASVAVDIVSIRKAIEENQNNIDTARMRSLRYNLNDINNNLKYIDKLVNGNFKVLAELMASSDVLSARAAIYLKMVENILKFPMKTAYGAIEFGVLAEFFDIKIAIDGSATVNVRKGRYVPYTKEIFERQCGTDWSRCLPDPGIDYENHINVGSVYADLLTDLEGGKLSVEKIKYKQTKEQTRGSGKCRQVVVEETFLPDERIVCVLSKFLEQIQSFLEKILNNEVMKSNAQIQKCIVEVSNAVERYSQMRMPFLKQLLECQEYQKQIFYFEHTKKILQSYFNIYNEVHVNSNSCLVIDNENPLNDRLSALQIERINGLLRTVSVDDVDLSDSNSLDEARACLEEYLVLIENANNNRDGGKNENRDDIASMSNIAGSVQPEKDNDASEGWNNTSKVSIMCELSEDGLQYTQFKVVDYVVSDLIQQGFILEDLLALETKCEQLVRNVNEFKKEYYQKINSVQLHIANESFDLGSEVEKNVELHLDNNSLQLCVKKIESADIKSSLSQQRNVHEIKIVDYKENDDAETNIESRLDSQIHVGSLCYSLRNLLNHEQIFGSLPNIDGIKQKIKYIISDSTNISDEEASTILSMASNKNYANYYLKYAAKSKSLKGLIGSYAYSIASDMGYATTLIRAYQEETLISLMQKNNLKTSSIALYEDFITSIRI